MYSVENPKKFFIDNKHSNPNLSAMASDFCCYTNFATYISYSDRNKLCFNLKKKVSQKLKIYSFIKTVQLLSPVILILFTLALSQIIAGHMLVFSITRCIPAVLITSLLCAPSVSSFNRRQPRPLSAHDLVS